VAAIKGLEFFVLCYGFIRTYAEEVFLISLFTVYDTNYFFQQGASETMLKCIKLAADATIEDPRALAAVSVAGYLTVENGLKERAIQNGTFGTIFKKLC
jgi:hypothetical protein